MKSLLTLLLFLLINYSWAQEDIQADTTHPTPLIERLFNTTDQMLGLLSRNSWTFIPAVTYSPETSVGLGARAIKIYRPQDSSLNRPSTLPLTFLYTLNKQIIFTSALDLWTNGNADHLSVRVELSNYPFKFYGIGNNLTTKKGEDYASKTLRFLAAYQRRLTKGFYVGPLYEFKFEDIYRIEPGGILASGSVLGNKGQKISGLGLVLGFDTRDNIFQPNKGSFHQAQIISYRPVLGSEFTFTQYRLDLRRYYPVYKRQILAVQAWYSFTAGHSPFQQVSLIGGSDVMRGYFEGKYRDRNAMVYQAEYRIPVYRKLGLVCFASAGQVADTIPSFSFKKFRYGGGLGFRYQLTDDGLNLRLDLAYGDQSSFYFGLNEVL